MSAGQAADVRASSSEGAPDVADDVADVPQAGIGWLRAIGSGLAVVIVGLGVTLFGTDWVLTNVTSLHRDQRVWTATALFLIVVGLMAWGLRRLQARGLI